MAENTVAKTKVRVLCGTNFQVCEHRWADRSLHQNLYAESDTFDRPAVVDDKTEIFNSDIITDLCDACAAGLKKKTIDLVPEKVPALKIGDIVEEVKRKRRGKICSTTDVRWQVQFFDGNKPASDFFLNESDLRLVESPDEDSGPGFVPRRGIMG